MEFIILVTLLVLSLLANLLLFILFIRKKPTPTKDALALLQEAREGGALVRIELLDHNDFIMRSPRR